MFILSSPTGAASLPAFKIEGAEGSQRRLWRQRFSQNSVSFSAFMRCPAISLTQSSGGRNNETPQDVRLLCNRPTFWPAGFWESLTTRPRTVQHQEPKPGAGQRLEQVGTCPSPPRRRARRHLHDLVVLFPSPVDLFTARCLR